MLTESVPCLTTVSNRFGLGICFFKAENFNNTSKFAEANEEASTLDQDLEMQYCSARPLKKQQQKPPNKRHTADQRFLQ